MWGFGSWGTQFDLRCACIKNKLCNEAPLCLKQPQSRQPAQVPGPFPPMLSPPRNV